MRNSKASDIIKIIKRIYQAEGNVLGSLLKTFYYNLRGKKIIAHSKVKIKNLKNIVTKEPLLIGVNGPGFTNGYDRTYINALGKLIVASKFSIYKGCKIYIGPGAVCELGSGYLNAYSKLIILNGLKIGDDCAIAWNCEFLDEDFHKLDWEGKSELSDNKIEIGSHVWIGSGVKILKGVKIGNNNAIAANSVVTKSFLEENVLIGGNPAKIIKRNISWE